MPHSRPDDYDATVPALEDGELLSGRYRLVRVLDRGGMGIVWISEDTHRDGVQVAIKLLPAVLSRNARAVPRFRREAEICLGLTHPHIIRLYNIEQDAARGDLVYLVMQLVEGRTLENLLAEQEEGMALDRVQRWAQQLGSAIDYAHEKDILHRDIKPSNVIIDGDDSAFLIDFGIAREVRDETTRVTGQDSSGTLLYMSPQQVMGENSKSNDIYSLAATLYEALSGEPPFHSGGVYEQIQHKPASPLPGQPGHVNAALLAGLAKQPDDRSKTAAELALGVRDAPAILDVSVAGKETVSSAEPRQARSTSEARAIRRVLMSLLLALVGVAMVLGVREVWASARERSMTTARSCRSSANRLHSTIRELDRISGFGRSIDAALSLHLQANEYFRREDYNKSIETFEAFRRAARTLLRRDEERSAASKVRTQLDSLRTRAKSVSSDEYPDLASKFIQGGTHWDEGVSAFDQGRFGVAEKCWGQARPLFAEAARYADLLEREATADAAFEKLVGQTDFELVRAHSPSTRDALDKNISLARNAVAPRERLTRFANASRAIRYALVSAVIAEARSRPDAESGLRVLYSKLDGEDRKRSSVCEAIDELALNAPAWWVKTAQESSSSFATMRVVARSWHALGRFHERGVALERAVRLCVEVSDSWGFWNALELARDAINYSERAVAIAALREAEIFAKMKLDNWNALYFQARIAGLYYRLGNTAEGDRHRDIAIPTKRLTSTGDWYSYTYLCGEFGNLERIWEKAAGTRDMGNDYGVLAGIAYYAGLHGNRTMYRQASGRLQSQLRSRLRVNDSGGMAYSDRVQRTYGELIKGASLLLNVKEASAYLTHITGESKRRSLSSNVAVAEAKTGDWKSALSRLEEQNFVSTGPVYWIGVARAKDPTQSVSEIRKWIRSYSPEYQQSARAGVGRGFYERPK